MFIVFLKLHSTSTSPSVPPFYTSSSDTYHALLHIFLYLLLSSATNSFSLPTPLSSTFLYVLLPVHHGATGLSPLSMLHSLAHSLFPLSILNPPLSTTPPLSILLLICLSLVLLLLLLINYKSNGP